MKLGRTGVNAAAKIPLHLEQLLKEAVKDGYLNTSDYVRTAIKEKLEREGYLKNSRKAGPNKFDE